MKAKVFVFLFCFLFIFTIFISNVSATTIEDLYSKDNVFTVKNLTTGETKEVTIPKFTKGDFSKATNYVLVYKNENDYFFQFTSDNKNYIVVYSNISGGYEIRRNGTYQVIGSDVYYQDLGDYYLSSSGNLYGENVYIYSTCDLYKVIDRDEAMQEDLPENAELITSGSMDDDTIGDPNSRLQVTYEYNEDNTECKINATIKDGSFTDKIFYSNYMPGPSGHLLTKQPFPIDGITVTENQSLFFQAEDKDGNIIATNSISIYGIGKLNPELFIVDIDVESGGHAYFTPRLLNSGYIYNDIYCKIDNVSGLRITKDGFNLDLTDYASEFAEGKLISSGQTWNIANFSFSDCTFNIHFEIKNRETGVTMLTKTYNLTIKLKSNGSINGGTINSGQDDEEIMTPDNDDNINNDLNVGIDWSLESSIDNIKNFFVTATEFFNLVIVFLSSLPMWIIMPIYTFLILAGIIFVFHAIRG